ncbi:hypothetical protein SVAN01_04649 [Stagonosporopsis vannaccii]|nr:hypothetical protein SVAN01_04649 [Stagonosporopsis vannaccii]
MTEERIRSNIDKVFRGDPDLIILYQRAFADTSLGPRRLRLTVERLLRRMAWDLEREAVRPIEKMENLTCHFVHVKARFVADCIVEDCYDRCFEMPSQWMAPTRYENEDKSGFGRQSRDDEVRQLQPEEDFFKDPNMVYSLLVHSSAFQGFHSRLREFLSYTDQQSDTDRLPLNATEKSGPQLSLWNWMYYIHKALISAMGLVEPQLEPGHTRIRWQCKCGDSFFCDVQEYTPGGISRLKQRMTRSGCLNVTTSSSDQGAPEQRYTLRPPAWLRSTGRSISSILTRTANDTTFLPQHHRSTVSKFSTVSKPSPPALQRELYLMACMHRTQHHINVVQSLLEKIKTDRQLFCFLRKQLSQHRSLVGSILSMKKVERIFFVKFRLRKGSVAEVRHHKTCCTLQICECIPPHLKVLKPPMGSGEYDCNPPGPPDTWPPVCPEFMMHMLYSPDCIAEDDSSILEQLPKKMDCKLDEKTGSPPEGWGLYFQEETDISTTVGVVFIVIFIVSLLFLVFWIVLEHDIQGASGMSSYIIAVASMLGIWIATRSKSFG